MRHAKSPANFVLLLVFIMPCLQSAGQTNGARVSGHVRYGDPEGTPVVGVQVRIKYEADATPLFPAPNAYAAYWDGEEVDEYVTTDSAGYYAFTQVDRERMGFVFLSFFGGESQQYIYESFHIEAEQDSAAVDIVLPPAWAAIDEQGMFVEGDAGSTLTVSIQLDGQPCPERHNTAVIAMSQSRNLIASAGNMLYPDKIPLSLLSAGAYDIVGVVLKDVAGTPDETTASCTVEVPASGAVIATLNFVP